MFGGWLAAQQNCLPGETCRRNRGLDLPGPHQGEEFAGVGIPAALLLFICVQHSLLRSKTRLMLIIAVANLAEEVGKVGLFGEPGELGGVIEPHIEESFDAVGLQCAEEFAGALLGKTDAVDLH